MAVKKEYIPEELLKFTNYYDDKILLNISELIYDSENYLFPYRKVFNLLNRDYNRQEIIEEIKSLNKYNVKYITCLFDCQDSTIPYFDMYQKDEFLDFYSKINIRHDFHYSDCECSDILTEDEKFTCLQDKLSETEKFKSLVYYL